MIKAIVANLKENSIVNLEPGHPDFFLTQRQFIKNKALLFRSYRMFYDHFLKIIHSQKCEGIILELGSGGSLLKDFLPDVTTSDVTEGVADLKVDAQKLPFKDQSLRAIFMSSVLHHIPNCELFFKEVDRCLINNGVCVMVEPTSNFLGRFFYKHFHHEPHHPELQEWIFDQSNSMLDTNQALSWIVFERDIKKFQQKFPNLNVECKEFVPTWGYILSGGVNYRPLIPKFLNFIVPAVEFILSPLDRYLSLAWIITIRKT